MSIVIQELDRDTVRSASQCDSSFCVESHVTIVVEDGELFCTLVPVARYHKQYDSNDNDAPVSYLDTPGKGAFVACLEGQIVGWIGMTESWNRYALIENLAVDPNFRRSGFGKALVQRAIRWGEDRQLPGVMLETQNNNVAACRLYESCGFRLGGFDRFLYKGLDSKTEEIALFWYLFLSTRST